MLSNLLTIVLLCLGATYITIEGANLRCYKGSFDNYKTYNLSAPEPYLTSEYYVAQKLTLFFMSGLDNNRNGDAVKSIIEASLLLSYNCCLMDWQKEASTQGFGELGYGLAVINAASVGKQFCKTIIKLSNAGLRLNDTIFVAFSLGGSLMGSAARCYKETGKKIPIIIVLDQAGPLYDNPLIPGLALPSISASDGEHVICTHFNRGRLATDESKCTVDVWANYESPVQPGCNIGGGIGFRTPENMCSHNRSCEVFGESMRDEGSVQARSALSYTNWKNYILGNTTYIMGTNIDKSLSGNFYFSTNASPPYGKREPGSVPN